jgi:CheY-like chemotaxis protein
MRHLVLADDSTTIQKVIQLSFATEDFEIHAFANGPGALEYLRTYGSDIVLADVSLPHLDGYDLCREIRQDPRTAGIPVVLLAGTFEPFDAERALEVGYTSLLVKPFETGKLVDLVKKLVGRVVAANVPTGSDIGIRETPRTAVVTEQKAVQSPLPIRIPVPAAADRVLFRLSPDQCRCGAALSSGSAMVAELSSDQMDILVEKVIERLPDALRLLLPDLAREALLSARRETEPPHDRSESCDPVS